MKFATFKTKHAAAEILVGIVSDNELSIQALGFDGSQAASGVAAVVRAQAAGISLYPGDIIATGTPVGVGIGFKPPKYLQRGDRVRVEIDGIGAIENPVI